jgi:hypothetical protein
MNTIHALSNITPHPDFDLFGLPPTQLTVEKDVYTEHRPISILSSNSVVQFVVPTNMDEYVQLRETLLYLKFKINLKKKDASAVSAEDWKKVAPVNYLLHSMFRQIDFEIAGKSITLSPQTYAYKARFEYDLGFTDDAKKSHLTAAGAYDDVSEKVTIGENRSKLITPATVNTFGTGDSIELMGKLHLDMAFQPRALLGGTQFKLTLVPNEPKFFLMNSDSNIIPEVVFENAILYVHRSKITWPVLEAHNVALGKSNAKYPICRSHVKAFNINSGNIDVSIDNAISGQLPRRVFLAMVTNDAFNGNYTKNPFNFEHFKLNHLAIYLDGEQYPLNAYKPNFEQKLYVREYMGLYEALNQLNTDSTLTLTKSQWAAGNTIFGFNFAPDLADDCNKMGYANPIRKGSLRIDLKFASALTETINVLLYCEYDNIVELTADRMPLTDYL